MNKLNLLICLLLMAAVSFAQDKKEDKGLFSERHLQTMKWRNVGPAFTSGRISDIAVHPEHEHTWYVATASSGVWKTTNSGTTWKSIFDGQNVFGTGCITIDPHNHHRIWLGTGENNGGRHITWGDGVYLSEDDGATWKNMGLEKSEHLSEIIIHPENPDIIWVASQGPLWSKGGERGFYMSEDGGKTWTRTLGDDEWTGVTDIAVDPRDPNVIYAATWERHRTVAAYMGGGKNTGIHRSDDGGHTWTRLRKGLPMGNMGKIGIAVSPQQPDVIYAVIELDRREGGLYKSTNKGASWSKQSSTVSGGTGPHYYQELYASPHNFDELYLMDVRVQVSYDGGKNFTRVREREKHSDNHAIVFREDDPNYMMFGTDAGIYETFDKAENWRFINNLPLTQYYKVAVDDQKPFYYIYGGTQDNGSHSGPSRTDEREGIRNAHWYKTLFADGHQSATEPGNPDIFYAETQQGGMYRIDRLTGVQTSIQPQPGEGEGPERFNWDAPIVVSPHNPKRLYFASQRVWRSEDRGDSWTAISGDLTTGQERIRQPIMGQEQPWDSPWDIYAMSKYSTITSLSESPLKAGLVYAGTDDGVIQMTEDGGATWNKTMISSMAGVPALAFVNDIRADLHDENIVYVCMDNHKQGDYKPYLMKSMDKGRTWRKASEGLPDGALAWRVVQDHENPELMFAATEKGVYVSFDRASSWMKFSGGLPTISIRDITIQRRENDLVAASFGRGFFVLDDYSALRKMNKESLKDTAALYPVKDALQFNQRSIIGTQGAGMYRAKNPAYGATFTYHINDDSYKSKKSLRMKAEGEKRKAKQGIPFPGWDALQEEADEVGPKLWLTVRDADGNVVKTIEKSYRTGIHQANWDLSSEPTSAIRVDGRDTPSWWGGMPVLPGAYSVTMSKYHNGELTQLAGPQTFEVKRLRDGALPNQSNASIKAYRAEVAEMGSAMSAGRHELTQLTNKVKAMTTAAKRTNGDMTATLAKLSSLAGTLRDMSRAVDGDRNKSQVGAIQDPNIGSYYGNASRGAYSSYGPTKTNREQLAIAKKLFGEMRTQLMAAKSEADAIEQSLIAAGAPYIMGQPIPKID